MNIKENLSELDGMMVDCDFSESKTVTIYTNRFIVYKKVNCVDITDMANYIYKIYKKHNFTHIVISNNSFEHSLIEILHCIDNSIKIVGFKYVVEK